mgnify:CR=1 FL=1
MQAYIVSRLITAVWVIAGLTSLVFFLIHWVPGDPVEVMLGESAAAADRAALRHALGLDQPLLQQWGAFLSGVVQLDLGTSLYERQPVLELLQARYPATLELATAATFFGILLGIPMGVMGAVIMSGSVQLGEVTVFSAGSHPVKVPVQGVLLWVAPFP